MPSLYQKLKKSISTVYDAEELDTLEEKIDAGYAVKKLSKTQSDKLMTLLSSREKDLAKGGDQSSCGEDYSDGDEYSD